MNQDLHEAIYEMVNTCASVVAKLPHAPPSAAAGTAVGGQRPVNPGGGAPGKRIILESIHLFVKR